MRRWGCTQRKKKHVLVTALINWKHRKTTGPTERRSRNGVIDCWQRAATREHAGVLYMYHRATSRWHFPAVSHRHGAPAVSFTATFRATSVIQTSSWRLLWLQGRSQHAYGYATQRRSSGPDSPESLESGTRRGSKSPQLLCCYPSSLKLLELGNILAASN
jgi:hypothetical protein